MTTTDMINLIRAGQSPLGRKVLLKIAYRLEEQDSYLRSALGSLSEQARIVADLEERLSGLDGELADEQEAL